MANKYLKHNNKLISLDGKLVKIDVATADKISEEKTVIPSTTQQIITPTNDDYELSKVTVNAIQTEEKTVIENGDVTPSDGKYLTKVTVNVPSTEPIPTQEKTANPTTSQQEIIPDEGYNLSKVTVNAVTSAIDSNILAENIKKDVTILDVTGTLEDTNLTVDYDETTKTLTIIDDGTGESLGGEYDLESVLLEDGTQKIVATHAGMGDEYQPNADMLWARSVLENDVGDTDYKILYMTGDSLDEQTFLMPANGAIKTSDGGYYKNDTNGNVYITHKWADNTVRVSQCYSFYETLRYVIVYFAEQYQTQNIANVRNAIYLCASNIAINQIIGGANYDNPYHAELEFVDFINGATIYDTSIKGYVGIEMPSLKSVIGDITVTKQYQKCSSLEYTPKEGVRIANGNAVERIFDKCRSLKHIKLTNGSINRSFAYWFNDDTALEKVYIDDTSNAESIASMFYDNYGLKEVSEMDCSKVVSANSAFYGCNLLKRSPVKNMHNVKNCSSMYHGCYQLEDLGDIDIKGVQNLSGFLRDCKSLRKFKPLDISSARDMSTFAVNAFQLEECLVNNTSKVTNFNQAWQNCENMHTLGVIDMTSTTNASGMLNYCDKIENLTLKNIKISLQIGSGISYGHLLTLDSLLNTIKELHDNTSGASTLTLTMGTANTAKLANTYVKLIDITDEMRAEDEYIDLKKPFEVCESTDEGAMHIIDDYVKILKNWEMK